MIIPKPHVTRRKNNKDGGEAGGEEDGAEAAYEGVGLNPKLSKYEAVQNKWKDQVNEKDTIIEVDENWYDYFD